MSSRQLCAPNRTDANRPARGSGVGNDAGFGSKPCGNHAVFADAGAEAIFDFVDMGLPSTVVPPEIFRQAMSKLLGRIAATGADVLVAEAGASPLEPYNGDIACELLKEHIACRVLSASDPYAVVGVEKAFGFTPDLVTGPAGNTQAARDLVAELTGLEAVNIMQPDSLPRVRAMLQSARILPPS